MGRIPRTAWIAAASLALFGCSTGPWRDNPSLFRIGTYIPQENPLYLPQGPQPEVYDKIFQKALDVVDDIFEIAYSNRYEGRIETQPRVSPGFLEPWKPGSPDARQRTMATLQTIRHRCIVLISTADEGGYYVDVKVLKELEDVPVPIRASAGANFWRLNSTIERQFEVIDQPIYESNWIPIGRDLKLEQVILDRLVHGNFASLPKPETIYGPAPAGGER